MSSILPENRRGRANLAIRDALRDLNAQLALLGQRVSGHLDLKGADLQCLDLIDTRGPLSPSALARLAGLHPATTTGVIDRLERDGWIIRERDPADRRGVLLRLGDGRRGDALRLFSGMNARMAEIYAGYSDDELDLIAGFVRRTADAARASVTDLDAI
jgi:DNA-binding MarR family transcriptional regulator